tara:strand:- start:100 stop:354 length:255 start_codon:yes stop_codon:yes gene_type:complete
MEIETMINQASVSDMFFNTDHINYRQVFDKSMKESGVSPSQDEIEQSLCEDAEVFLDWASPIIERLDARIPTTNELARDFLARL